MWDKLNKQNKEKYKSLITNFASLSEAFSQKIDNEEGNLVSVAPIVNSKFQETAFQRSFGAMGEDIANTSYDASLEINTNLRYLIGIKSFGIHSGDQKIAQFKKSSAMDRWSVTLAQARVNAEKHDVKGLADKENEPLYRDIATKIAILRNERIASSKELIRGFDASDELNVNAIYHVLMPSRKGEEPQIFIGEIEYLPIDIDNIKILGSTSLRTPSNFKFTDGKHHYKYSDSDSQLFMNFCNKDIIVDSWDVNYVKDAFSFFENLHITSNGITIDERVEDSVSWMISNKYGHVEESSGFNGFDGASKLRQTGNYREKRINQIKEKYESTIPYDDLVFVISYLEKILLNKFRTKEEKRVMKDLRDELKNKLININNFGLKKEVFSLIYRPVREMYIPIPESRKFHEKSPNFFGNAIGTFKSNSSVLALDKSQRQFQLEFLPSGDSITAYINQDNGKSIQSISKQSILGEWILRGVFQLGEYERLTNDRLNELGINAIRLTKFTDKNRGIGLEFIWIDVDDPPKDSIGWVSQS